MAPAHGGDRAATLTLRPRAALRPGDGPDR